MALVIITFFVIVLVMLMMSVGVLLGRKPVQGSCGGLNNIEGLADCEICGGDSSRCEEKY
jgi:hypothetical protein